MSIFARMAANFVPSLWKAVAAGSGFSTGATMGFNLAPILFPHCGTSLCLAAGGFLGTVFGGTIWGTLAGVGVKADH